MKYIKRYITFLPLTLLSMYLAASFVNMTFDPNKWGALVRFLCLFVSIFSAGIITITSTTDEE